MNASSLDGCDVDVCVVGAGPHALSLVTHLVVAQPSLRERIVVLDPSGEWLATWRAQFARLEIDVLRSPSVHHCEVDPGALAQHVIDERLPRSSLPYDPPLTSVFDAFCRRSIGDHDLAALPVAARVTALSPGGNADEATTVTTDRGTFRARHVAWTGNTCTPIIPPAFVESIQHTRIAAHSSGIDLRNIDSLEGEHVAIVGGGLSAGHLLLGALSRGATATLVTRRAIVERDFDVEPGWLGPRNLDAFQRITDPARRLTTARNARGGGSMPGWMHRRIRSAISGGCLDHVVGEIDDVAEIDGVASIGVGTRRIAADRCWLATGSTPDVRIDRALGDATDRHVDGVPIVDQDLRAGATGPFVAGRLATIELGPAAGNLWGARMAARRISRAITGIDLDADAAAAISPPIRLERPEGART